jgi:hypothetical protein
MKINKTLLFSFFCLISLGTVRGADITAIQSDAQQFGKWFSQELGHVTAVNALSGPQLPGDVHSMLGVEIGLSAVVSSSKLDLDSYKSLSWTELQPGGFHIPSDILVAMPMVHAKVGLPYSLDLGVKYGYARFDNSENGAKSEVKNSVIGVEVRRRLMGEGVTGAVLPDVALSLAYDQANGDVKRTERYSGPIRTGNLEADTTLKSEWKTGAVTARVVASKQILIMTPYLGLGYSRIFGDTDTTVDVVGTALTPNDVNVSEKSSANAKGDLTQLVGGVEFTFFPTLKFNVGGLYAKDDWAATAGVRFTFR